MGGFTVFVAMYVIPYGKSGQRWRGEHLCIIFILDSLSQDYSIHIIKLMQ